MPIREKISSIKQAIVYLGESETRKLIAILTTGVLAFDKPKELIRVAIWRARFCEILISSVDHKQAESAFLTGLFSLLDAVLDQPMDVILDQLPLSKDIEAALRGTKDTPITIVLRAVKLYESGSWYNTTRGANKLGISYEAMADAYSHALDWVEAYDKNE